MIYGVFDDNNNLIGCFSRPQEHLGRNQLIPDKPGDEYSYIDGNWVLDKEFYRERLKQEAQKRIIALTGGGDFWREKQMNLQSRMLELLVASLSRDLSQKEILERSEIESIWTRIKKIREFSNIAESFNPTLDVSVLDWPV